MKVPLVILAVAAILALGTGVALADQVYPSQHIALTPVGDNLLRSGFVENIHTNGPRIFAHEQYVLNGAEPGTSYSVWLYAWLSTSCSGDTFIPPIHTADISTNESGNGTAEMVFLATAALPPPGDYGISWKVTTGGSADVPGTPAYMTACSKVTLDAP